MVSARRAARAGLDQQAPDDDQMPPAWFWQFRERDWGLGGTPSPDHPIEWGRWCAARREWRTRRTEWLLERGLVAWGMRGLNSVDFQRILREEPHRVLVRPQRGDRPGSGAA